MTGLVSLPTSDTRCSPSVPFGLLAGAQAARQLLNAFRPDPCASKLSRLRRSIGAAARCIETFRAEAMQTVMVTLTYRGGNEAWNPRHISEFLKTAREWCRRREIAFRYVWVAELQKRGVIHYHVALWLPAAVRLPKPDECGWWPHGMTRIELARRVVPYLCKYLSKGNDAARGSLPYGARSHGRGGLGEQFRALIRWLALPAFIQAQASVSESTSWRRAKGGGWTDPEGTIWPSEFTRAWVADGWSLVKVHDHGRPFPVDGPYSRVAPC